MPPLAFVLNWRLVDRVLVLFLCLIWISGCGARSNVDVRLYKDAEYELSLTMSIPRAVADMAGIEQIEQQLAELVSQSSSTDGAQVTWRRSRMDNELVVYVLETKGRCTESDCSDTPFSIRPSPGEDKDAIYFSAPGTELARLGDQVSLTLHVTKVLSSNGTAAQDGEVTWSVLGNDDPWAVVVPLSRPNWLLNGLLVLAAVLLVAGVILFVRNRRGSIQTAQQLTPGINALSTDVGQADTVGDATARETVECSRCHFRAPTEAHFCPRCGAKLNHPL